MTTKLEFEENVRKLTNKLGQPMDLIHCTLGMITEASEIGDAVKAHIAYNRPLDKVNLVEELGDLLFFMQAVCQQLDVTLEQVMAGNVAKLNARYKAGFSEAQANNRKKEFEMEQLKKAAGLFSNAVVLKAM